MQLTKQQEEKLAKEVCFYLAQVKDCCGDCDMCEGNGKWKQYKLLGKRVAEKWEKIKEVKE